MYDIDRIPFGKIYLLKLSNLNTGEYVTVLPEAGAALHQVCLALHNKLYPLLWSSEDGHVYLEEVLSQYRGALLMPFVDRIENGRYSFKGVEYSLPCNEPGHKNALHGFIHDKAFLVTELSCDEKEASAVLRCQYLGTHPGYPFLFEATICYTLNQQGFQCVTKIQNNAPCSIPLSMGWHPYFQMNGSLQDYEIKIPAISSFAIRDNYINTGEVQISSSEERFLALENFNFNAYALRCENGKSTSILRDKINKMNIIVKCRGFPFLQVYVVAGRAVAVEPVTSVGNSFNNGVGLIILSPKKILEAEYSIAISGEME